MKFFLSISAALSLVLIACSSGNDNSTHTQSVPVPFTRIDKIVADFASMSPEQQLVIADSLSLPLGDYIFLMGASSTDIATFIDSISHTAAFHMFEPEVERIFHSTTDLQNALGTLDANLRRMITDSPNYSYYGIISPYLQKIMLVDSDIYIALNHYLGPNHAAYSSMPEYARATKTPAYIPFDIAHAILSIKFPFSGNRPTAIQYFMYRGAELYAISSLTGITDTATLMGWSPQQLSCVEAQEHAIWHKMAADNIIYSTDRNIALQLCEPAPASRPISDSIPGGIGCYIGYRIVTSYIDKHPDTPISFILSPDFYDDPASLIHSGYSPKSALH